MGKDKHLMFSTKRPIRRVEGCRGRKNVLQDEAQEETVKPEWLSKG